jgi:hypothetical protein
MSFSVQVEGMERRPSRQGHPMSRRDFLCGLRDDEALRQQFSALLCEAPHTALFWECPGMGPATLEAPMAWVCLPAPGLDGPPDPSPFADPLREKAGDVVTFSNLRGDATLVVPRPRPGLAAPHLLAFLRGARPEERSALWAAVGAAALAMERPFYLSTAGMGVAWLHVRLDARPKYYRHAPYRR